MVDQVTLRAEFLRQQIEVERKDITRLCFERAGEIIRLLVAQIKDAGGPAGNQPCKTWALQPGGAYAALLVAAARPRENASGLEKFLVRFFSYGLLSALQIGYYVLSQSDTEARCIS